MGYEAILYKKNDSIATVTINQPQVLNALVQSVFDDLAAVTKEIAHDDDVKSVVLTGAGKAFCAGGDVNRFKEGFTLENAYRYVDLLHPWCLEWANLSKPTIAAINGPAVGAGMSIALLCDMSIASDQAKLGSAFINMALVPDLGAAYFLPRAVGPQKAKELLLTGRIIDSAEALSIGLVNSVVPHDRLMDEAYALAKQLSQKSAYGIQNTKRLVNMGLNMDLRGLLEAESFVQALNLNSDDSKAAVDAFLNKRS
jgi:2-(1,2-epoxy-1,2-dihydrophenyl)acetyl-CoA isomerase